MSKCGCGSDKRFEQPFGSPNDIQARQMVQVPQLRVDEVAPQKPDTSRLLQEFAPQPVLHPLTPSLPSIFRLETPMTAIAMGGFVPHNVVALLVPAEGIAPLLDPATLAAISQSLNMNAPLAGFLPLAGLDQYWIMRPGEIVEFGRILPNGVVGIYGAPWSGLFPRIQFQSPGVPITPYVGYQTDSSKAVNCILNAFAQQNLQAGVAQTLATGSPPALAYGSSFDPWLPTVGPIFAPVFRAAYGRTHNLQLPWQRTPWHMPNVAFNELPRGAVCIPPGTRTITLSFSGGTISVPTPQRDASTPYGYEPFFRGGYAKKLAGTYAGPFDVTIEWIGFDGLPHFHPGDQLTAAGRGQITPQHDIEVYEVPGNVAGMNCYYAGATPSDGITMVHYTMNGASH